MKLKLKMLRFLRGYSITHSSVWTVLVSSTMKQKLKFNTEKS